LIQQIFAGIVGKTKKRGRATWPRFFYGRRFE
jgi:hypothetical protein